MNASIIEKVRKLRALAKSSNANEAAAAAAAADRLIQEHRLSEAELHAEAPEEATDGGTVYREKRAAKWRSYLTAVLARHYGCHTIREYDDGGSAVRIYGTPSDVELVKYMYAWLTLEAERLVKSAARGRTERNSWFYGFASGVKGQLDASRSAVEQAATRSGRTAGLVHLASALTRARAVGRAAHPGVRQARPAQSRLDPNAFGDGQKTGANMHLGADLTARPTRMLGSGS